MRRSKSVLNEGSKRMKQRKMLLRRFGKASQSQLRIRRPKWVREVVASQCKTRESAQRCKSTTETCLQETTTTFYQMLQLTERAKL